MPTVMVTGAGRGLGFEFARQYAAEGWRVIATCRNFVAKAMLEEIPGTVDVYEIDVTRDEDIAALKRSLGDRPIDVLINNAGIYGPRNAEFGHVDETVWHQVLSVNAFAALRLVEAFADNVAASDMKRIAAITSKMGSMTDNTSGGVYIYRSSKAALNALMRSVAIDLAPRGITTILLHPGWVHTDMGGPNALITPEQSVAGMRRVIAELTPADNGTFRNYDGAEIGW